MREYSLKASIDDSMCERWSLSFRDIYLISSFCSESDIASLRVF
jgi:hypothetical protein